MGKKLTTKQDIKWLKQLDGQIISILNRDYDIKIKKTIKNNELLGRSKHRVQTIELSLHQTKESFIDTLLHEILHCLWYSLGFNHIMLAGGRVSDMEESMVLSLSGGIMTVMRQNPWLIEYLAEG